MLVTAAVPRMVSELFVQRMNDPEENSSNCEPGSVKGVYCGAGQLHLSEIQGSGHQNRKLGCS